MATPLTIDGLPSVSISAGSIIAVVTGGLAKRSTVEAIGQNFTSVVATTSVVTPLVGTDTATNLSFKVSGATQWFVDGASGDLKPNSDDGLKLGGPANRVLAVFTPIIDSGTTGSLSLRTNNGSTQLELLHAAGANHVTITSGTNPTISTTAGSLNLAPALQFSTLGAFAASDKYLIVDSSGNVHKSALGPAS